MPNKKGFTLIELVGTMSILVIVMVVLVYTFLAGQAVFNNEKNTSDCFVEASKAIELMSKEIRSGIVVNSASSTSITFWYSDLDNDLTSEASEIITYSWGGTIGGNLVRTLNGASYNISRNVSSFNLTYDNATAANIKSISMKLSNTFGGKTVTIESTSELRNHS